MSVRFGRNFIAKVCRLGRDSTPRCSNDDDQEMGFFLVHLSYWKACSTPAACPTRCPTLLCSARQAGLTDLLSFEQGCTYSWPISGFVDRTRPQSWWTVSIYWPSSLRPACSAVQTPVTLSRRPQLFSVPHPGSNHRSTFVPATVLSTCTYTLRTCQTPPGRSRAAVASLLGPCACFVVLTALCSHFSPSPLIFFLG